MTTPKLFGKNIGDVSTVVTAAEKDDGLPKTIDRAILEGLEGPKEAVIRALAASEDCSLRYDPTNTQDKKNNLFFYVVKALQEDDPSMMRDGESLLHNIERVLDGLLSDGMITISKYSNPNNNGIFWTGTCQVAIHPNYINPPHVDQKALVPYLKALAHYAAANITHGEPDETDIADDCLPEEFREGIENIYGEKARLVLRLHDRLKDAGVDDPELLGYFQDVCREDLHSAVELCIYDPSGNRQFRCVCRIGDLLEFEEQYFPEQYERDFNLVTSHPRFQAAYDRCTSFDSDKTGYKFIKRKLGL